MGQELSILLTKLKKGDKKAFNHIFKMFYKDMLLTASFYIDLVSAEDIIQDIFANIWINRKKIDINKSFRSYLISSVRNRCLKIIRHKNVEEKYQQEYNPEPDYIEMDETKIHKLRYVIETLPPQCKKVLKLSVYNGLKYKEISEELDISINTVKSHLKKAFKTIKNTFDKETIILYFLISSK